MKCKNCKQEAKIILNKKDKRQDVYCPTCQTTEPLKTYNQKPTQTDINNAEHPARQKAIKIIEDIIEPICKRGVDGEEYYELEDRLTNLINE